MSDLKVSFWGTRGSVPTPGRSTGKYGGNTTCVEVRHDDDILVFDAGSGIREMGVSWLNEFKGGPVNAAIAFTHLHWDHIQGFPFFPCAYMPQNKFTVYGEERESGVQQLLSGQMTGDYFPIQIDAMQAGMEFRTDVDQFSVGSMNIRSTRLPHPGGSLGYRVEAGSGVFVFATDCELDSIVKNPDDLKEDFTAPRKWDPELLDFFRGANLIVIDCQYTDEVYKTRVGWGHNSIATIVDLARQVHPDMLALFHHDPQSNDQAVIRMSDETAKRMHRIGERGLAFAAREGLTMKVGRPKPPPALR